MQIMRESSYEPVYESVIKTIVNFYGADNQKVVAIEELGELIQAITKDLRGKPDMRNITEELADVKIMIDQLIFIYGNYDAVIDKTGEKLARQVRRLVQDMEGAPNRKENLFNSRSKPGVPGVY